MKILFELLYIRSEESSGIALYAYNLITNYNRIHPEDKLTVMCWDFMLEHMKERLSGSSVDYVPVNDAKLNKYKDRGFFKRKLMYYELYKLMKLYDVCISTWANISHLGMSPFIRHIGVVHDLQYQKLFYEKQSIIKSRLKTFVQFHRFSAIVAISNCVRRDLWKHAWTCGRVIYNSCGNLSDTAEKPIELNDDMEYILDVNAFYAYKNPDVLIEAFNEIKDSYPSLKLYLKGKDFGHQKQMEELIMRYNIKDRVIIDTQNRSRAEMTWLFRNARVFVTPSTMEGFGYTPIEAIISKTPVISSNIDTLKEVLGDTASYFDPHSSTQLVDELKKYLDNPPSESELVRRASTIREKYSESRQVSAFHKLIHRN